MKIYRHGDLLIREIKELPKDLKKLEHTTLALGEATGHHHTLIKTKGVQVYENEQLLKFFVVKEPTDLTHQEHKTIVIEPAKYEVIIEREFDPFSDLIRQVKD